VREHAVIWWTLWGALSAAVWVLAAVGLWSLLSRLAG